MTDADQHDGGLDFLGDKPDIYSVGDLKKRYHPVTVAVFGASGYTGAELMRLLAQHPGVKLLHVTSQQHAGKPVGELFPNLARTGLVFAKHNPAGIAREVQVAFLCLPHRESMTAAKPLRAHGVKVIDLSADFRFRSIRTYEKTYGPHAERDLNKSAAYGLCEIFREDVRRANLVAAPGCYVTSVLLALAPLIQRQIISLDHIVCDVKSGVSGAGRKEEIGLSAAEMHGDFRAYGVTNHRHRPEIEEKLAQLAGREVKITFTPHLLPVARGILSTVYARPFRRWSEERLRTTFEKFYRKSPFVRILPVGVLPRLKGVVGTNECHLAVNFDAHSDTIIVLSAIDNLIKGASGQAVQCFNLMYGLPEETGLTGLGLFP